MSRAAHLKKPRRDFFPRRTIRRVLRVALAAFSAAPWQGFEKSGALPQPRLPVSAAGGGRLRCCSNPPLRRFTNFQIKQKLQCHYNTGVLGGRGWITQAAHLKRPRRGLFAAGTYGGGPYELRLPIFLQPLGGALKNRSAAPTTPRCFRRWRRSSSLQSAPLLFESTLESETSVFL